MALLSVLAGLISWIVGTVCTLDDGEGGMLMNTRWQDWIKWVLGLWLFLSPAVLQFGMTGHAWNVYLVATGIAWIAVAALATFRPWQEWIAIALGAWLLVSPWLLGFGDVVVATWNAMVVGALVVVLAAWVLGKERSSRKERSPGRAA